MHLPIPKIPGVRHQYITVNKIRIHVAEAGEGKPLILIHGWPQHWYVWRKLIPLLSSQYKLIMPDLPGFGWSEPETNNDYRKETLATIIIKLIEELNLKQVGLVGHDWGGWIGFLACLQKPEMFTRFLALGISHPFTIPSSLYEYRRFLYQLPIATPLLGELLLLNFPFLIEWLLKKGSYQKDAWTEKDLRVFSNVLQEPIIANASSLLYRDFLTKEFLPILFGKYKKKKLEVPASLLIGQNDPVINPSLFKGFHNPTNNISIKIIKNCGHFIPEEKPELVAKEIANQK